MKARITSMMRWALVASLVAVAATLLFRPAQAARQQRDGSHDFDWEVGVWNTHLRVLRQSSDGTTVLLSGTVQQDTADDQRDAANLHRRRQLVQDHRADQARHGGKQGQQ